MVNQKSPPAAKRKQNNSRKNLDLNRLYPLLANSAPKNGPTPAKKPKKSTGETNLAQMRKKFANDIPVNIPKTLGGHVNTERLPPKLRNVHINDFDRPPNSRNKNKKNTGNNNNRRVVSTCDIQNVLAFVWNLQPSSSNAMMRRIGELSRSGTVLAHLLHMVEDIDREIVLSLYAWYKTTTPDKNPEKIWASMERDLEPVGIFNPRRYEKNTKMMLYRAPVVVEGSCKMMEDLDVRPGKTFTWGYSDTLLLALGVTLYGANYQKISSLVFGNRLDEQEIMRKVQAVRKRRGQAVVVYGPLRTIIANRGTNLNGYTPPFIKRQMQVRDNLRKTSREIFSWTTSLRGVRGRVGSPPRG